MHAAAMKNAKMWTRTASQKVELTACKIPRPLCKQLGLYRARQWWRNQRLPTQAHFETWLELDVRNVRNHVCHAEQTQARFKIALAAACVLFRQAFVGSAFSK